VIAALLISLAVLIGVLAIHLFIGARKDQNEADARMRAFLDRGRL
jgi:hypothetical protein